MWAGGWVPIWFRDGLGYVLWLAWTWLFIPGWQIEWTSWTGVVRLDWVGFGLGCDENSGWGEIYWC